MRKLLFVIILSVYFLPIFALNGSLLLIGGGSEKDLETSWSTDAYTWAVNQSTNKKVAVISFSDSDDWLTSYFVNTCGATEAQNFLINSNDIADNQTTYDDLITYDVVFLKGGDQYNYYSTYKNTKTQEAIEYIFENGGVICGTSAGLAILSGVVFTAENGSVYPDESIQNPLNEDITLANDMFQFFPGFVFDTHFTIRARFARLLGFMANWKFNQDENIQGIGVDEMTALAINTDGIGTAYGIGTANIYQAQSDNTFSQSGNKLLADSVKVIQLLQGCTYNFNTGEVDGFTEESIPEITEETGNYTIFASGTDNINYNGDLITEFSTNTGSINDKVLIFSPSNSALSSKYYDELEENGVNDIEIVNINSSNADNQEIKELIAGSDKFIFVDNEYADVIDFINGGIAGTLLNKIIRQNNAITCFIGDNSRFIGKTVVANYLSSDAAYYGELEFVDGLSLLQSTVIIPNTYFGSNFYENTTTAVPFAMVTKELSYGIWLSSNNYIKYSPNNNKTYLNASGNTPVMVLKNDGTESGTSIQTAYGDGLDEYPQYSGFKNMTLSLIDETTPYKVGNSVTVSNKEKTMLETINISLENKSLLIIGEAEHYDIKIVSLSGKVVHTHSFYSNLNINTEGFPSGIYIIQVINRTNYSVINQKVSF